MYEGSVFLDYFLLVKTEILTSGAGLTGFRISLGTFTL